MGPVKRQMRVLLTHFRSRLSHCRCLNNSHSTCSDGPDYNMSNIISYFTSFSQNHALYYHYIKKQREQWNINHHWPNLRCDDETVWWWWPSSWPPLRPFNNGIKQGGAAGWSWMTIELLSLSSDCGQAVHLRWQQYDSHRPVKWDDAKAYYGLLLGACQTDL